MAAEAYRRWLDDLWNGDLDQLETIAADVVASDFIGHWPLKPDYVHGPAELAAVIREGRTMFDELRFELRLGPIVDGDLTAARWVGIGSYNGKPVEFCGHDILRLSGGRFVEYWSITEDPTPQLMA